MRAQGTNGGRKCATVIPCERNVSRDGWVAVPSADTVDQHAHRNAALDRATQRVDKLVCHLSAIEDVGGEHDGPLRAIDCGEHGGIGLVAVHQHVDVVARDQRHAGRRADERSQWSRTLGKFDWNGRRTGRRRRP